MYISFHNLAEKPFQISTDPRFLWLGEKHREALANLKYGLLDRNGYVVLTGDVGTGKTTLINALIESLDERILTVHINHPSLDTLEFLSLVAKKLDPSIAITNKSDLLLFFESFLNQAQADDRVVLLIIDEAHRLSVGLLEEIRLLSNIESAGQKLINIFFVGQNELKPLLLSPQCQALRQRVTLFYDILPLTEEETAAYVIHRLKVAGTELRLFTQAAVREIYGFTKGCPRLINVLCDRALLTGYVEERHVIDAATIMECAREMVLSAPPAPPMGRSMGARALAWRTSVMTALRAGSTTVAQGLRAALKHVNVAATTGFKQLGMPVRAFIQKTCLSACAFVKRNKRKIIPAGLLTFFVVISIGLTIGAYTGANIKKPLSMPANSAKSSSNETSAPGYVGANPDGHPGVEKNSTPVVGMPEAPQAVPDAQLVHQGPLAGDTGQQEARAKTAMDHTRPARIAVKFSFDAQAVPAAHPFESDQARAPDESPPDTIALATAGLDRKEFQAVISLFEANGEGDQIYTPRAGRLYSMALVGQAGLMMDATPPKAEALLAKAVAADPENARAHFLLGNIYRRNSDYPHAIEAYNHAVQLRPDFADALFNLGFVYATMGNYAQAEEALFRTVQLKPTFLYKGLFNLAVVQQKLGKKQDSLTHLEQAVTIDPENPKAKDYLERLRASDQTDRSKEQL